MSVVFAGNWSGTFVSNAQSKMLILPAGADYCRVENETQSYAAGAGQGVEFFWRQGMVQGRGTQYIQTVNGGVTSIRIAQIASGAGFYLFNNTINTPQTPVAVTAVSNGVPSVVTTASSAGLIANTSIVRLANTSNGGPGASQLAGYDFTIGTVPNGTSFQLAFMTIGVAAAALVNATYSIIPYNPYFYPTYRYITNIGADATGQNCIVTLSVTHGYQVGQQVRFDIPTVTAVYFGMTQLNGMQGTIIATGAADANGFTNTITVNINITGFTAFAFPINGTRTFTPAMIVPIGENTAVALNPLYGQNNILSDATVNQGAFGLILQAGANSPAGTVNNGIGDTISWQVGKSFNQ
jgi:hypothetical protein